MWGPAVKYVHSQFILLDLFSLFDMYQRPLLIVSCMESLHCQEKFQNRLECCWRETMRQCKRFAGLCSATISGSISSPACGLCSSTAVCPSTATSIQLCSSASILWRSWWSANHLHHWLSTRCQGQRTSQSHALSPWLRGTAALFRVKCTEPSLLHRDSVLTAGCNS